MIKRKIPAFDLHKICNSGQCFRMKPLGENRYGLTAFGEYLEMEQEGEVISFSCTGEEFSRRWEDYFDLYTDYEKMVHAVNVLLIYRMHHFLIIRIQIKIVFPPP